MTLLRNLIAAAALLTASPAAACQALTVYFDWNSATIAPRSAEALRALAIELAWKGPDLDAVLLTSHTDMSGSHAANREMAWARARAVRDVLMDHDVPLGLIRMEAVGVEAPIVRTPAQAREPRNRRVELRLQLSAEAQARQLAQRLPLC